MANNNVTEFVERMRKGLDKFKSDSMLMQPDATQDEEAWWEEYQTFVEDFGIDGPTDSDDEDDD